MNKEAIKVLTKLSDAGFNTEKAILGFGFSDIKKVPGFTMKDVEYIEGLQKAISEKKVLEYLCSDSQTIYEG